ncbi:RNA ligase [Streptomyces phage Coruscant]|uniref:RNA ligase n=1 Tax=Streptomyces phage Coruscant TaxID=2739834 RepID=A0A7G4AWB5_9CAUD|nr:RNA ligase [Streptomyces phage Coruscant]QMP84305.1 RNA ligase [Streptomyces phage Coruscant]
MKFTKIFSQELLDQMVNEGLVRVQTHPSLPYRILNYTEQAQFKGVWNTCTLVCRGLVIDDEDNIIARPFHKFFNMGDSHAADIDWDSPVEITDKKDGSMGILYAAKRSDEDELSGRFHGFATRGSFTSDQARHATQLWHDHYAASINVPTHVTFIFEIVYPDNRIVLDYGQMDDLILLGAVSKRFGFVHGPDEAAAMLGWTGPKTEVFSYKNIHEAVAAPYRKNAEGLVIRSGRKMVKLKQADYVELHRLISMLSERSVWSQLKDGQSIMEICEALPDEFHDFVRNVGGELEEKFFDIASVALKKFSEVMDLMPEDFDPQKREHRAMFAREANKIDHYRQHMFQMIDNKPFADLIWKQIKPEAKKEDGYPAS